MNSSTQIKSLNNQILDLRKVGIIYNTEHSGAEQVAGKLEQLFNNRGIITEKQALSADRKHDGVAYLCDITFAVVIGGDGSLLGAARFYAKSDIPIFGINVGRLGFLAQLNPHDLEEGIEKIFNGQFKVEERLMLKAYDKSESPAENHEFELSALNDIVIKGGTVSRTARLYLYINGKHVCDYLADGLIISTPTGSTAYTLSAGGPVLVPGLNAMVIVPICPHSLTTRPLVIPESEEITVKTCSNCELIYLTADGQENIELKDNNSIFIKQYEKKAKLILLEKENNGFYSVLREKLHWGLSPKG